MRGIAMPLGHSTAHLGRYRRIAEVLGRHGLAYLAGLTGLEHFLHDHPKKPRSAPAGRTPPEHVRMALEELGATFVRSSRPAPTSSRPTTWRNSRNCATRPCLSRSR